MPQKQNAATKGARLLAVIVHHCLTIHRALLNTTSHTHRRTVGWEYCSVNVENDAETKANTGLVINGELVADPGQLSEAAMREAIITWHRESQQPVPDELLAMDASEMRAWLRDQGSTPGASRHSCHNQ